MLGFGASYIRDLTVSVPKLEMCSCWSFWMDKKLPNLLILLLHRARQCCYSVLLKISKRWTSEKCVIGKLCFARFEIKISLTEISYIARAPYFREQWPLSLTCLAPVPMYSPRQLPPHERGWINLWLSISARTGGVVGLMLGSVFIAELDAGLAGICFHRYCTVYDVYHKQNT